MIFRVNIECITLKMPNICVLTGKKQVIIVCHSGVISLGLVSDFNFKCIQVHVFGQIFQIIQFESAKKRS